MTGYAGSRDYSLRVLCTELETIESEYATRGLESCFSVGCVDRRLPYVIPRPGVPRHMWPGPVVLMTILLSVIDLILQPLPAVSIKHNVSGAVTGFFQGGQN